MNLLMDSIQDGHWSGSNPMHRSWPVSKRERVLGQRVDMVIVLELGKGEEVGPIVLPLVDKYS